MTADLPATTRPPVPQRTRTRLVLAVFVGRGVQPAAPRVRINGLTVFAPFFLRYKQ